ncbi:MAG: hypothetical protein D6768_12955 [Chloroflexi bacterium]|nr:MAG: hypothetical protein D6768_12955 [Chloroflexota bacterium]
MKKSLLLLTGALALVTLAGCGQAISGAIPGMGMMGEMGPGGMMARHHATIDSEYAGLTNPVAPDAESLARGESLYTLQCATCHGDGGMGDGPAGVALDPAPAPVAHTSRMLGDDYLFWRISEGGNLSPFNSAMPGFKSRLTEQERWDIINYIHALGSGRVMPKEAMGGRPFDPEFEVEQRTQMLKEAVKQNVLTMDEAELFDQVHSAMDELMAGDMPRGGGMAQMQEQILADLVSNGKITAEQADAFSQIHDSLLESGLMK